MRCLVVRLFRLDREAVLIQMCDTLDLVISRVRPLTTMNIAIWYCAPIRSSGVIPFRIRFLSEQSRRETQYSTAQVAEWVVIVQETSLVT